MATPVPFECKVVLNCIKLFCQLMDEFFRGVIAEVKLAVLNFAHARKADA